eukprot:SAG11_NODE_8016_length_1069_cov_1.548454_1_plen_53_part_00
MGMIGKRDKEEVQTERKHGHILARYANTDKDSSFSLKKNGYLVTPQVVPIGL